MLEITTNESEAAARIIVVGVGGGGNNAVNRMVDETIGGVEFVGANTDKQALSICKAPTVVQIGEKVTKGLGAGGRPEVGEQAAMESEDEIRDLLFVIYYKNFHRISSIMPLLNVLRPDPSARVILFCCSARRISSVLRCCR